MDFSSQIPKKELVFKYHCVFVLQKSCISNVYCFDTFSLMLAELC